MKLRAGSLAADPGFRSFWAGQSISQLGDRVSELALPLIAVQSLAASSGQVALLTALIWTPNLLAVAVGTWVDRRVRQRRLLIAADLIRAVLLLSLPIGYLFDAVTLPQLYLVALLTGAAAVLFNSSYQPFFARLVPRSAYLEANSKLSTSRSASFVVGPAAGGLLIQLLGAPLAMLADVASFLGSAALVARVPLHEPEADRTNDAHERQSSVFRQAAEGLRFTLTDRYLRASLACASTLNLFTFLATGGLVILFARRNLDLPAGVIGLAFGVGAVGSVVGALLAPAVARRIGLGPSAIIGAVLYPAPIALIAAGAGPLWLRAAALAASEVLSGAGVMLFDINLNSIQTALVPDGMRARVSGAYSTVNYGVRPIGALLGGVLASTIGLRATLLVAAIGGALSVLWLLGSPIAKIRTMAMVPVPGGGSPSPQRAPSGPEPQ